LLILDDDRRPSKLSSEDASQKQFRPFDQRNHDRVVGIP
jgi:hypothetical protein